MAIVLVDGAKIIFVHTKENNIAALELAETGRQSIWFYFNLFCPFLSGHI